MIYQITRHNKLGLFYQEIKRRLIYDMTRISNYIQVSLRCAIIHLMSQLQRRLCGSGILVYKQRYSG